MTVTPAMLSVELPGSVCSNSTSSACIRWSSLRSDHRKKRFCLAGSKSLGIFAANSGVSNAGRSIRLAVVRSHLRYQVTALPAAATLRATPFSRSQISAEAAPPVGLLLNALVR